MKIGMFLGMVADETGIPLATVSEVHEAVEGMSSRGSDLSAVTLDMASRLMVGLCVRSCGTSAVKAGNVARTNKSIVDRAAMAMQQGIDFRWDLSEPTVSLTVGATIRGRCLKAIGEAGGFFCEADQ